MWHSWCLFKADRSRLRRLCGRIFGKIENANMSRGWVTWKLMAEKAKKEEANRSRLRRLCVRIFGKIENASMSRGWVTWKLMLEKAKKEEYVVGLFARRWRNLKIYRIFKAWEGWWLGKKNCNAGEGGEGGAEDWSEEEGVSAEENYEAELLAAASRRRTVNAVRSLVEELKAGKGMGMDMGREEKTEQLFKLGTRVLGGIISRPIDHWAITTSVCFHGWSLVLAIGKSRRTEGGRLACSLLCRAASKLKSDGMRKLKSHVAAAKVDDYKLDVAAKTRARLVVQAKQQAAIRDHGLRIGRKVLDKLTENRRTNVLEKSFGKLRKNREMKVRGVELIRRWITRGGGGGKMWAFCCWRANCEYSKHFAQRMAFLNTSDETTRARLKRVLDRWANNVSVGTFGLEGNGPCDKKRAFGIWKIGVEKEKGRERKFQEVDGVLRRCWGVMGEIVGELDDVNEGGNESGVCYNVEVYRLVGERIGMLCNKKNENGASEEIIDNRVPVRGCIVMEETDGSGDLLLLIDSQLQKIKCKTGVVGEMFASTDKDKRISLSKCVFKDPRYDGPGADNAVLAACGMSVRPSVVRASEEFQRNFMNMSQRITGIRGAQEAVGGEVGNGNGNGVGGGRNESELPDLAMLGIPIEGRKMICAIGPLGSLDENVVARLGSLALAVGGGLLID